MKKTSISKSIVAGLFVALTACGAQENVGVEQADDALKQELATARKRLELDLTLTDEVTPTADPCVITVRETGTGESRALGSITWKSDGIVNLCTQGQGQGDMVAIFSITDASGDKLFGQWHTDVHVEQDGSLHWQGTWEFVSGTGKYANVKGSGTIPPGSVPSVPAPADFHCELDGRFSL